MNGSPRPPKPFRLLLPALVVAVSVCPVAKAAEDFREFTNQSGQKMRAAIVSATETEVTLKREDGAQITGGISFFSAEDQARIAEWRKANPVQYAYDFDIQATRQRVNRNKSTEGNLIAVYETWKFTIKVENRSKSGNAGTTVEGIEIFYNLSKTAKSRARQARELHQGLVPAGGMLVKVGNVDLGTVEYLKSKTVETEAIPINHSELAPGWYYADGSKDEHNDVLEGITIQIRKDGKVIAEKAIGTKAATDAKWVDPGQGGQRRRQ